MIHDQGAVLRDMAVAIADGTDCISDARVLRDQPRVFGPVASIPTMWRSLNEIDHAALGPDHAGPRAGSGNGCGS